MFNLDVSEFSFLQSHIDIISIWIITSAHNYGQPLIIVHYLNCCVDFSVVFQ